MTKSSRTDINKLFNITTPAAPQENREQEESFPDSSVPSKKKRGRKPLPQKNIQVSVYLRPEQIKELKLQDTLKEKEKDRSAIIRTGINIVLGMSSEIYLELKKKSKEKEIPPGKLIETALRQYFKKS